MSNAISSVTPHYSTPYITIQEYKQAPTAVDVDDLVGGGTSAINDQELENVVARASSWIDSHCNQVLGATVDTDSLRCRVGRDGLLTVHPRFAPVTQVVSMSYGPLPSSMSAVDVSMLWIEPQQIVLPLHAFSTAFVGPLQFGGNYSLTQDMFVNVTYVNGYANTVASASVAASATSIPVSDLTGFSDNMTFEIFDGEYSEILTVGPGFSETTGAGNLPVSSPSRFAHAAGVAVSALPPAVKQAAIYVTSAILKSRGNASLVMQQLTPGTFQNMNPSSIVDLNSAWDLLRPYRRIR